MLQILVVSFPQIKLAVHKVTFVICRTVFCCLCKLSLLATSEVQVKQSNLGACVCVFTL